MTFFDFKSIPPCLQQWLPLIIETSKIQCGVVIPQVIDENRWLFLNLSQHELQIASDIWLIIKNEHINISNDFGWSLAAIRLQFILKQKAYWSGQQNREQTSWLNFSIQFTYELTIIKDQVVFSALLSALQFLL